MSIIINNSLTNKKENFTPINPPYVTMYTCGVTVYDVCHIGHARSLYIFDVIRKYLLQRGFKVKFVRNITDVDDKIIQRAAENSESIDALVQRTIAAYHEDMNVLGIQPADVEPRATEHIHEMIAGIECLIKNDRAYAVDGNVYFSVRSFPGYGKLSGQSIEHMQDAVRIDQDTHKKDPLDFALWKTSRTDEPGWDSPWGYGRPGWHIECSCMSLKHLKGPTIDIHAGGRDLIFPHHENEVAQSESMTGETFANYWIHHGLLTIDGQKMAKSSGNFITIKEAISRYGADALKLFFLSVHYGSSIDFSDERLDDANKALQKFKTLFRKAESLSIKTAAVPADALAQYVTYYVDKFMAAMDDDFNTAKAVGILFEWVSQLNRYLEGETITMIKEATLATAVERMKSFLNELFGLELPLEEKTLDDEIAVLLEQRQAARQAKDFGLSDQIRDALKDKGIIVEDTREGQKWHRL